MNKIRLDQFLLNKKLANNIQISESLIRQGLVYSSKNVKLTKPGTLVNINEEIYIKKPKNEYVSRGAIKLKHAIEHFGVDIKNKICIDIGCAHGGFTQMLLLKGAAHIYAVDVGYGDFDFTLRQNDKITLLERTNARHLTDKDFSQKPDIIVCDVSFISIEVVLQNLLASINHDLELIFLIKPQFEVSKHEVEKGGIIKSEEKHIVVCNKISNWLQNKHNFTIEKIISSPILGHKGNKEFLMHAKKI